MESDQPSWRCVGWDDMGCSGMGSSHRGDAMRRPGGGCEHTSRYVTTFCL